MEHGREKNEKTNKQQHRWVWPANKLSAPLIPHVRKSGFQNPGIFCLWNPESGNVLLVEFGILGLGIRNAVQGNRNPTNDCNPESKFQWQGLEYSTWNPECKTILGSLTWGEWESQVLTASTTISWTLDRRTFEGEAEDLNKSRQCLWFRPM